MNKSSMSYGSHCQSSPGNGQVRQSGNRDPFEVAKEQFLDTLAADERLPSRQRSTLFKVGWKLIRHTNREIFKKDGVLMSWPGLETMASDLRMEKHTILAAIRTLAAFKYLGATLGKPGRGTSNTYYLYTPNSVEPAPFRQPEEIVPSQPEKVPSEFEKVPSRHINSAEPAHLEVPSRHQNLLNEPLDRTVEEPPEGTEGSPYIETEGSSASLRTPESPSSIPIADPSKGQIPTTSQDPSASETLAGEKVAARGKGDMVECYRVVIECSGCGDTGSPHMIPVAHCEVIAKGVRQLECEYCSSKLRLGIEDRLDYPKSQLDAERAERAARRAERDRRNMAQVKRGSELFNEQQGEVRHLRTVQIEETRETPLDFHEDPDEDYCQDDDEPDGLDTVG